MMGLKDLLDPLLAADSAALVAERLAPSAISDLGGWFSDEDGGLDGRFLLHRAPVYDTWLGRVALSPDPELTCAGFFGAGVATGLLVRRDLTGDTLFPEEVPFEAALERLRTVEDVPGYLALEGGGARSVGRQVLQLDRRIDLSVEACFRLAVPGFPSPGLPELRLLFAAGLVAAGVEAPLLPAACELDLHEAA